MSTKPRMSAPIGRIRINSSERKGRATGSGRWRPTDPPVEAESQDSEEPVSESTHPPFYPYPLRDFGDER
jgi:hypothetical protein